jgi:hypothetical protein
MMHWGTINLSPASLIQVLRIGSIGSSEENRMTQKLVTTFILLLFLVLAFALLGAFSAYFETLTRQLTPVSGLQISVFI